MRRIQKARTQTTATRLTRNKKQVTPVTQRKKAVPITENAKRLAKVAGYRKRFVAKAIGYTKASEAQIAEKLGISERHVRRLIKEQGIERKYKLKTGVKKGATWKSLTKKQKVEIKRLNAKENLSEEKIAEKFGVSQPAIHYILTH